MEFDRNKKYFSFGLMLLLIIGLGLQLYFLYFGYIYNHYLVSPGGDMAPHFNMADSILKNGFTIQAGYPPLFHFIVAKLSILFHTDIMTILTYWTPILAVLPSLAIYFFLRQLFDQKISTITTLILLLSSQYPILAFVDGNYPDMLAYGVFAILLFAFIIRYYKTQKFINLIIALILLVLIALTHSITFVSVLSILVIFGILQIVGSSKENWNSFSWKKLVVILLIILGLGSSIFLANKMYGNLALGFVNGIVGNQSYIADDFLNKTPSFDVYPFCMGNMVWYIGLVGLLLVIISAYTNKEQNKAKQLVIIWFLFYFLISRIASVGVPVRFAREIAPPLIICIGFLLNGIFSQGVLKSRLGVYFGYGIIGFIIITNSALHTGMLRLPDGFKNMVWFSEVDQKKVDYLAENLDSQESILFNPKANLYTPIKVKKNNSLTALALNEYELATVVNIQKSKAFQEDFDNLVAEKKLEYKDTKYIFIDKKAVGNTDEKAYPTYANYEQYSIVLEGLAKDGELITEFSDGTKIIKANFIQKENIN